MKLIPVYFLLILLTNGCALVDWHCTKGGQWSSYYASGDGRCTYFCADRDEKYCASTPIEAETLQANALRDQLRQDPSYQREMEERRLMALKQDKRTCQALGFKEDTDGMANCLLVQQQNHLQEIRDKESNLQGLQQLQIMKQEGDRQRVQGLLNKITPRPSVNCRTYGNMTTCQ